MEALEDKERLIVDLDIHDDNGNVVFKVGDVVKIRNEFARNRFPRDSSKLYMIEGIKGVYPDIYFKKERPKKKETLEVGLPLHDEEGNIIFQVGETVTVRAKYPKEFRGHKIYDYMIEGVCGVWSEIYFNFPRPPEVNYVMPMSRVLQIQMEMLKRQQLIYEARTEAKQEYNNAELEEKRLYRNVTPVSFDIDVRGDEWSIKPDHDVRAYRAAKKEMEKARQRVNDTYNNVIYKPKDQHEYEMMNGWRGRDNGWDRTHSGDYVFKPELRKHKD